MFKKIIKKILPKALIEVRAKYISRKIDKEYENKSPEQVFSMIYQNKSWGGGDDADFFSGSGSHDSITVDSYVDSVKAFLASLPKRMDVVDVGCGDFNVGKQIRNECGNYIACDIVAELIERNIKVFQDMNVDFRTLNIIDDFLPDGEVIFIRQVLQHLNNEQISKVVPKLNKYNYIVLTEHLPSDSGFKPNLDKPAGPGIRMAVNSGVVITEEPFLIKPLEEKNICIIQDDDRGGVVKTSVYKNF